MSIQLTLSVICVFRNRKEWIEPTLNALYSLGRIPCEFIFIDDGSTDGSAEVLRSLIEHYQHERTFYFEQETTRGRGPSLNFAIEQAGGRYIWIPESINRVDEEKLGRAIEKMEASGAPAAIATEEPPPASAMDWLHLLQNDRLPFDRNYLFNQTAMRATRKFTDPHWSTRHATEWAIRLQSDAEPVQVAPFAFGDDQVHKMDDRSKKECIMALLRVPELSLSGQERAFRMLRSYGHTDLEEDGDSLEHLYQEAHSLFKTGNSVAALELLNRILAADPGHKKSREFKIDILSKMRRYVEAAEVKHGYQQQKTTRATGAQSEQDPDSLSVPEPDSGSAHEPGPNADAEAESDPETGPDPESSTEPDSQPAPEEDSHPEPIPSPEPGSEPDAQTAQTPERKPEQQKEGEPELSPKIRATGYNDEIARQPPLTIIIPTSTNRRPVLEECLTSVLRYTSRDRTRIVVVDNGSVDDTPDYLDRLLKENVALTVLTNEQNLGFAAAVNQGLAKAGNGPVMVLHNDVRFKNPLPSRLAGILERYPDIGLVTPKADRTWHEPQSTEQRSGTPKQHSETETASTDQTPETGDDTAAIPEPATGNHAVALTDVDYVDGYCMVFRNEPGLTFNKNYGLAYFEDADFCFRIQKKGYRVVVADHEEVVHRFGTTTGDLGLTMRSKKYWKNAALFHHEWHIEPQFPAAQTREDPLNQFLLLGSIINPFYPEKHLLDYFHELFTSEQKTRVFHSEFPPDALKSMIRLMMAANQREILRRLEQQLEGLTPDLSLYHDLIVFYFDRTIYSRCKMYLEKLGNDELPVDLNLYRLKIAIGEKDYMLAAERLQQMMDIIPTHPEVLLSASEIHRRNGNHEQSEKFIRLAKTFDPYIKNRTVL